MKYQVLSVMHRMTYFVFFIFLFFNFSLNEVTASRLYFEGKNLINKNSTFEVVLKLDTEGANINAVEGSIVLPSGIKLRQIRDGGSFITLWITEPTLNRNYLSFSGIVPGGYEGELSPYWGGVRPGEVLTLIFEAVDVGQISLVVEDSTAVLLNDSEGTRDRLFIEEFKFLIVEGFDEIEDEEIAFEEDFVAPENFTPVVALDASLFSGKYFVAFKTQDKGVGVNYYEIVEERGKQTEDYQDFKWKRVESPYLLEDQSLKSFIYIKAIDRNGNTKVAVISPLEFTPKNEIYAILAILITLVLFVLFRKRFKTKT